MAVGAADPGAGARRGDGSRRPWTRRAVLAGGLVGLGGLCVTGLLVRRHRIPERSAGRGERPDPALLATIPQPAGGINLATSPDGSLMAVGRFDAHPGARRQIELYRASDRALLRVLPGHPVTRTRSVDFAPDGRVLLSAGTGDWHRNYAGGMIFWSLPDGRVVRQRAGDFADHAVAFCPDGRRVAVLNCDAVEIFPV